ncbi:hypothetical protein Tco_0585399 [Tanacetum coccineum]
MEPRVAEDENTQIEGSEDSVVKCLPLESLVGMNWPSDGEPMELFKGIESSNAAQSKITLADLASLRKCPSRVGKDGEQGIMLPSDDCCHSSSGERAKGPPVGDGWPGCREVHPEEETSSLSVGGLSSSDEYGDEGVESGSWIGSTTVVGTGHSPHELEDEGLVSVGRDSGTGASDMGGPYSVKGAAECDDILGRGGHSERAPEIDVPIRVALEYMALRGEACAKFALIASSIRGISMKSLDKRRHRAYGADINWHNSLCEKEAAGETWRVPFDRLRRESRREWDPFIARVDIGRVLMGKVVVVLRGRDMKEGTGNGSNSNNTMNQDVSSINDPLYIASSDHLGAKLKLGLIDGTCLKPPIQDVKYQRWIRCNYMVTCWILKSMVAELSDAFLYADSAYELWKEIYERYGQSNGPLIYQNERELINVV